jgi:hypothetical protein
MWPQIGCYQDWLVIDAATKPNVVRTIGHKTIGVCITVLSNSSRGDHYCQVTLIQINVTWVAPPEQADFRDPWIRQRPQVSPRTHEGHGRNDVDTA